jgi:hypothetical protein
MIRFVRRLLYAIKLVFAISAVSLRHRHLKLRSKP